MSDYEKKRFEFKQIIERLNEFVQDPDIISEEGDFMNIADNAKKILLECSFMRNNDYGYIHQKASLILNDC